MLSTNAERSARFHNKLDFIGISTSVICAIHCAAMPFVASLLPLMGLDFLNEIWIEISISLLSVMIALSSFIPSYRKHGFKMPMVLLALGFSMIFFTHFLGYHSLEPVLVPTGAITIAVAHYQNWRIRRHNP